MNGLEIVGSFNFQVNNTQRFNDHLLLLVKNYWVNVPSGQENQAMWISV